MEVFNSTLFTPGSLVKTQITYTPHGTDATDATMQIPLQCQTERRTEQKMS